MSTASEQIEQIDRLAAEAQSGEIQPFLARERPLAVRRHAARALAGLADGPALDSLGRLMVEPEPGFSDEVLGWLEALPGVNGARVAARGLAADDPFWRYKIIRLLAARADSESVGLLLPAGEDQSLPVRRYVLRALRRLLDRDPERIAGQAQAKLDRTLELLGLNVERCLARLSGGPAALRQAAARRLGRLGGVAAWQALAGACRDEETGEQALAALEASRCPASAFEPLLAHPAGDVRRRALKQVVARDEASSRRALEAALDDPELAVRRLAAEAFCRLAGEEQGAAIAALLGDTEPAVRLVAARALAARPGAQTAGWLRPAIDDADPQVARRALVGLARSEVFEPELLGRYATLLEELAGQSELDREAVDDFCRLADCFGKHGGMEAGRALELYVAAARSASTRVRRVAVDALQRFPAGMMLDGLARLADTRDRVILREVALKLGEAGHPEGLLPLVRLHYEVSGRTADRALQLLAQYGQLQDVEFLLELLGNAWSTVRRFAAERLCRIDDERMIEPLLSAMEDSDQELQFLAVLALAKYAMHEQVSDKLTAKVEFGDLPVRQMAVDALGEARAVKAVPVLVRSMGNPFLRPRVEKALAAIGDRKGLLAVKRRRLRDAYIAEHRPPSQRDLALEALQGKPKKKRK